LSGGETNLFLAATVDYGLSLICVKNPQKLSTHFELERLFAAQIAFLSQQCFVDDLFAAATFLRLISMGTKNSPNLLDFVVASLFIGIKTQKNFLAPVIPDAGLIFTILYWKCNRRVQFLSA
jgi:hypothetical protein